MPHHFNSGSINRSRNQGSTKIHSKKSPPTYHPANEFSGTGVSTIKKTNTSKSLTDFRERNLRIYKTKSDPHILLSGARSFLEPGYKRDLDFFTNKVLSSDKAKKNIGYTKEEFANLKPIKQDEVAKAFRTKRNKGFTDAYGNVHPNYRRENIGGEMVYVPSGAADDGGSSRTNVVTKSVGGKSILTTEGEVAENKAATETQAEIKLTKRRIKARGRKTNIYTGSSGEAKDKLILGKKTLLGYA